MSTKVTAHDMHQNREYFPASGDDLVKSDDNRQDDLPTGIGKLSLPTDALLVLAVAGLSVLVFAAIRNWYA